MEGNNSISKFLLGIVETFISDVTTDKSWTGRLLQILFLAFAFLWIYCGYKFFSDAKERYRIGLFTKILVLIFSIITGPIGLIIYLFTRPKYTLEELEFLNTEQKFYYQNASKVLECTNCGHYLLDGYMFCTECGEQNRLRCENCNVLTNLDDKFCYYCGYQFSDRTTQLLSRPQQLELLENTEISEDDIQGVKGPIFMQKASNGVNLIKRNTLNMLDFSSNFKNTFKNAVNLNTLHFKNKDDLQEYVEVSEDSAASDSFSEESRIGSSNIVAEADSDNSEVIITSENTSEKNTNKRSKNKKKKNKRN